MIEASTTEFASQCYELYEAPPLGTLVRTGDDSPTYGIVHEVATRSPDPGRRPIPRGRDEDTEEGVYQSHPQLARLLRTEFRSMVVGHRLDGLLRRYLGPVPPRIYSFVFQCDDEEVRLFSDSLEFLPILLAARIDATDDVIASFLRQASLCDPDPERFLIRSGKELAALLSDDVRRLTGVLRRISP